MTALGDDVQQYNKLIEDIHTRTHELLTFTKNLEKNEADNEISTEKGISLLELKNHLMTNYLIELTNLLLKKVSKKSIKNDASVDRLAETRVEEGSDSDKDISSANEEDKDDNVSKKNTSKYIPPKLLAMPYDDDDEKNRKMERAKKRTLSSSLVQELHQQYSQAPEEIQEYGDHRRQKHLDNQKHRTQYEENNLIRIQVTKKQRQTERKSGFDSTLNSLLSFGDYNVEESMASKKKKTPPAGRRTRKSKDGKGKKKWKK